MDDLQALILDFDRDIAEIGGEVQQVVSKGALNIKQEWRQAWSNHPHIVRLPASIGYDLLDADGEIAAEIGPNLDSPQGPLAHIIELGSPTSPPLPAGQTALDAEEPRFVAALEKLGGRRISG